MLASAASRVLALLVPTPCMFLGWSYQTAAEWVKLPVGVFASRPVKSPCLTAGNTHAHKYWPVCFHASLSSIGSANCGSDTSTSGSAYTPARAPAAIAYAHMLCSMSGTTV